MEIKEQTIKGYLKLILEADGDMQARRNVLLQSLMKAQNDLRANPKSHIIKQSLKKRYADLEKFDRNIEKDKYGISYAKSIFKKLGITAVQYASTAIRGYNTIKKSGYQINNHNPSRIDFMGITENTFDKIVNELKNNGFTLSDIDKPSKSIGFGLVGSVTIEKFHLEEPKIKETIMKREDKIVEAKKLKEQLEKITGSKVSLVKETKKVITEALGIFKTKQELLDALKEVGLEGKIKFGKGVVMIGGQKIKVLSTPGRHSDEKDYNRYKKVFSEKIEKAIREVIKDAWQPVSEEYTKMIEQAKTFPKIDIAGLNFGHYGPRDIKKMQEDIKKVEAFINSIDTTMLRKYEILRSLLGFAHEWSNLIIKQTEEQK